MCVYKLLLKSHHDIFANTYFLIVLNVLTFTTTIACFILVVSCRVRVHRF